jgi:hypothetical protein
MIFFGVNIFHASFLSFIHIVVSNVGERERERNLKESGIGSSD